MKPAIVVSMCLSVGVSVWVARIDIIETHTNMANDLRTLECMNANMRRDIYRLQADIHAMQTNSTYVERVIRDELGYQKPGDLTFLLEP